MDKAANINLPARLFERQTDGSRSWGAVPWSVLDRLRLNTRSFSAASRSDGWGMYLDEDYDVPAFEALLRDRAGLRAVWCETTVDERTGGGRE